MNPSFYAIIPADVRYEKSLTANAKLLYGEITALCNQEGFCWADNKYFAALYSVDHKTISRWISSLENVGFLVIEHYPEKGNMRKIFIKNSARNLVTKSSLPSDKIITRVVTKSSLPSDKIVTPIYDNITINNTMNKEKDALSFLEVNFRSQFDILMMQFKKQINEFVMFSQMFNATVEQEGLEFNLNVLSGRFKKYALNWIKNQSRFDNPVIELNPRKEKIGGF
jgi:hypothetical protein